MSCVYKEGIQVCHVYTRKAHKSVMCIQQRHTSVSCVYNKGIQVCHVYVYNLIDDSIEE